MRLNGVISECFKKYDNFYLYDEETIIKNIIHLKQSFPQVNFLYSIKCNPNVNILHSIFLQNFGADAASLKEVFLAHNSGLSIHDIYYSAPGKSIEDIKYSIDKATLIADSINEIEKIQLIAEELKITAKIGIRINPKFSFLNNCGQASKFGIDEEQALSILEKNLYKNIKITGIHVHLKSQELNMNILSSYYKKVLELSKKFEQSYGELEYINMGSGIGVQYATTDPLLNVTSLGLSIKNEINEYKLSHPNTKIIIEVGRYVVCKSGYYVTKVMDRKISYGKIYLILKNTLNGFIRPSIAKLIQSYLSDKKTPSGSEPLFTSVNAFEFLTLKNNNSLEKVTLVGNLCTSTDIIAEDIFIPHLDCGDAVIITNAGSYGAVLSPIQFSMQDRPKELFFKINGEIILNN